MTPAEYADRVLEAVGDRASAEVMATTSEGGLTRFANSFIHQHVGETRMDARLTVMVDGKVATVTTTRQDRAGIEDLVSRALASAAVQPPDRDWPGLSPPAETPPAGDHFDEATATVGPHERAAAVTEFIAAGEGMTAAGYCDSAAVTLAYANSAGNRVAGRYTGATIDGIHQTDGVAGAAHQTSGRFGDLDGAVAGARAAATARRAVGPHELDPGEYEVVLAPECVATIGIFLGFYGFNAKQVEEGQSFLRIGEQQFDPAFSLCDDATRAEAMGPTFDAEGTPKRRVDLVASGVSTAVAHDRRTAGRAGTASTGHAVPGSAVSGPITTDLFVAPGSAAPEEMIGSVDRGLWVTTFNYCRVLDPKSLVVTGLTRNGTFLVEGGEIVRPVADLRFTQSFVEALGPGRVLQVGGDARFADSEFGGGIVHAPSLRLAAWRFTGGASG